MSDQCSVKREAVLRAPKRRLSPARKGGRGRYTQKSGKTRPFLSVFVMKLFIEGGMFTLTGLIALLVILAFYASDLPRTDTLWRPDRAPRYTLLAADGSPLSVQGTHYGAPVRLSELPAYVTDAVLAVEDRNFRHHVGVNPFSVGRALVINASEGAVRQGGSTITQQLAKNLFLSSDRTLKRKIQELMLALWLEHRFSKDEILTLYLNRVYLGGGAYGIDAASYRYFGKSARDLALNEAALIAGLLKAPSRYNPTHNPQDAGLRAQLVIESMVVAGSLSEATAREAIATPIYLKPPTFTASAWFVDHALSRAKRLVPDNDADLVIRTTFDPDVQHAVETGLYAALAEDVVLSLDDEGRQVETAIVIADRQGAVRAMIGGRDYGASQFNRATQAKRQPGSAFKPFVFLAALQAGAQPDNLLLDAPITIGKWSPGNYKGKYYGEVTLTEALAKSMNAATIRLQEWVGRDAVRATAKAMGFTRDLNPDPALALGVDAVSPLELAQAYVPIANGGLRAEAHVIDRIETAEGVIIYDRQDRVQGVAASAYSISQLNMMLRAVTERGTGRNAQVKGWAVAGKTGTTQGSRDAWFAGHMAGLVTVVWTGYDDYKPMQGVTGGRAPAKIWGRVMTEVGKTLVDKRDVYPPQEFSLNDEAPITPAQQHL